MGKHDRNNEVENPARAWPAPTNSDEEKNIPSIDEYHGRGGSYVMDADTLTRKPNIPTLYKENAS